MSDIDTGFTCAHDLLSQAAKHVSSLYDETGDNNLAAALVSISITVGHLDIAETSIADRWTA